MRKVEFKMKHWILRWWNAIVLRRFKVVILFHFLFAFLLFSFFNKNVIAIEVYVTSVLITTVAYILFFSIRYTTLPVYGVDCLATSKVCQEYLVVFFENSMAVWKGFILTGIKKFLKYLESIPCTQKDLRLRNGYKMFPMDTVEMRNNHW